MKRSVLASLLALSLSVSSAFAQTYTVDPASAEVKWSASKVAGKHNGHVSLRSGVLEMADGGLSGGEAVIDMTTIVVDDIQDPGMNAQLTSHLKSADFFDVENHPTASLKVTGVKPGAAEGQYEVTADLTIKGVTKPVTLPVDVRPAAEGVSISAKLTVDRTAYDIRYGSGKFFENLGDKMIHDTFDLEVSGSAK